MKHIGAAYRRVGSIRKAGQAISLDGAQHGESQGTRNIAHVGIQVIQTVSRKNLTLQSLFLSWSVAKFSCEKLALLGHSGILPISIIKKVTSLFQLSGY